MSLLTYLTCAVSAERRCADDDVQSDASQRQRHRVEQRLQRSDDHRYQRDHRVTSEITVPPMCRADINITISAAQTPLSAVDLVITDVVFIGRNIPCLVKQIYEADVSSW